MKNKIKWWEKTEEYKFIIDHIGYEDFICPLDGSHERAGDTLLSREDKFILIEFKRDENYHASEKIKFTNYSQAKQTLQNRDSAHFVVYGVETMGNLSLEACTYFSNRKKDLSSITQFGMPLNKFKSYIEEFVSFKEKGGTLSSGFSSVAVIQYSDDESKCMRFEEFSMKFDIDLEIDPPSIDGPSMSM